MQYIIVLHLTLHNVCVTLLTSADLNNCQKVATVATCTVHRFIEFILLICKKYAMWYVGE